jgi:hypothetical protein
VPARFPVFFFWFRSGKTGRAQNETYSSLLRSATGAQSTIPSHPTPPRTRRGSTLVYSSARLLCPLNPSPRSPLHLAQHGSDAPTTDSQAPSPASDHRPCFRGSTNRPTPRSPSAPYNSRTTLTQHRHRHRHRHRHCTSLHLSASLHFTSLLLSTWSDRVSHFEAASPGSNRIVSLQSFVFVGFSFSS